MLVYLLVHSYLYGSNEWVKEQFDNGIYNQQDTAGNIPMHYLFGGNYNNCELDMELYHRGMKNSDLKIINNSKSSPLHFFFATCIYDESIAIEVLLSGDMNQKNDKGNTPLHYAFKQYEISVFFLRAIKAKANLKATNNYNNSPLHLLMDTAVSRDILMEICDYDVDFNQLSNLSLTPLHIAFKNMLIHYDVQLLNKLLVKGDPDVVGEFKKTPLHFFLSRKEFKLNLIDVIAAHSNNKSIMIHMAIESDLQPGKITLLLNEGYIPENQDSNGNTALHIAVLVKKEIEIPKLLILSSHQRQVDIKNIVNNNGQTPLMLAIELKNSNLIKYLSK